VDLDGHPSQKEFPVIRRALPFIAVALLSVACGSELPITPSDDQVAEFGLTTSAGHEIPTAVPANGPDDSPRQRWTRSGSGPAVFEIPAGVSRVKVVGTYRGKTSPFIVEVDKAVMVNELLGTFWELPDYERELPTGDGVLSITSDWDASWSVTEVE